jgi:CDGSH-type Zn-finger protein
MSEQKIKVTKDGPYLVSGSIPLEKEYMIPDETHDPVKWEKGAKFPDKPSYALCRCGKTKTPPYCDGTHTKIGFKANDVASCDDPHLKADITTGPELVLSDAEKLCSIARYCHRMGDTWTNTEKSDDPVCKQVAIQTSCDCPSGRLIAMDKKTGKPIEPDFKPSISVTEDLAQNFSGPLWVKGGVEIGSSDGKTYFKRNRVTLCRCGASKNKPFCDGSHCKAKFNDGDEKLK